MFVRLRTPDAEDAFELRVFAREGAGLASTPSGRHYLLRDSAGHWFELTQERYPPKQQCPCKNRWFHLHAAYDMRQNSDDIKHIAVHNACIQCGRQKQVPGVDIDYAPARRLRSQPLQACAKPRVKGAVKRLPLAQDDTALAQQAGLQAHPCVQPGANSADRLPNAYAQMQTAGIDRFMQLRNEDRHDQALTELTTAKSLCLAAMATPALASRASVRWTRSTQHPIPSGRLLKAIRGQGLTLEHAACTPPPPAFSPLTACASTPPAHQPPAKPAPGATISICKSDSARQCEATGGLGPADMQARQLAGIRVLAARKDALRGMAWPAVCSGVNVYTIRAAHWPKTQARGFQAWRL